MRRFSPPTPDYASAERKLRLLTTCFVGDVKVKMVPIPAAQTVVENGATANTEMSRKRRK